MCVESDHDLLASRIFSGGTDSIAVKIVDQVPPEMDPLSLNAVMEFSMSISGPARVFSVLLERKTLRSEGTLSKPAAGMMIERVLDAM